MSETAFAKERKVALHIIDKHICYILESLRSKGYYGAIRLLSSGRPVYSSRDFGAGTIDGHIVGKADDNGNVLPVRYIIRENYIASLHNTPRQSRYTLEIHEGEEKKKVMSIEDSSEFFSRYARKALDDLESFVMSLPPAPVNVPVTRENLRRAMKLIEKTNVAAGLKSHLLTDGAGDNGCLYFFTLDHQVNRDRVETSSLLHALTREIDNPGPGGLDSLINDPSRLPGNIKKLLHETIIPMLPLLDENELLAEISTTEEGKKLFDFSETVMEMSRIESLLKDIEEDLTSRLSSKYGAMSAILKARQTEIFLALHTRPYVINIPINKKGIPGSILFESKEDRYMEASPLSDAAPGGSKTKLASWEAVGRDISKLLMPKMGLTRPYSLNNKIFSEYVTGNTQLAGHTLNYFSHSGIIAYYQTSDIGGLCCNNNMFTYERVARMVIFNAIMEGAAKFRETGERPVFDMQSLKAMAQETVNRMIKSAAEGIFSVYTGVIDELMLKFNTIDAGNKDENSSREKKVVKKPSDDIKKTTVLIARQIMAGLRKMHEKFHFSDLPEEAECLVPIMPGDRRLGEISFLPYPFRYEYNNQ